MFSLTTTWAKLKTELSVASWSLCRRGVQSPRIPLFNSLLTFSRNDQGLKSLRVLTPLNLQNPSVAGDEASWKHSENNGLGTNYRRLPVQWDDGKQPTKVNILQSALAQQSPASVRTLDSSTTLSGRKRTQTPSSSGISTGIGITSILRRGLSLMLLMFLSTPLGMRTTSATVSLPQRGRSGQSFECRSMLRRTTLLAVPLVKCFGRSGISQRCSPKMRELPALSTNSVLVPRKATSSRKIG